MDAVKEVTSAAKSAFSLKFIVGLLVGMVILFAILDATGLSSWIFTPVTRFKIWNAQRKVGTASGS